MSRTQNRPLPSGSLDTRQTLIFASLIGSVGMILLITYVNWLTAILTFFSLVGYAGIYTLYLKHATPQNIVIGGAAGATPPLLGWTAMTGHIDSGALLLFLIIFTWTPPHFWALAIHRKDEYAKANVPMLPVTHGEDYTRLQILLYTVLLTVVTMLPYLTGMSGLPYLVGVSLLDGGFLYYAIVLYLSRDRALAMRTFGYSIVYLMLLFALLLADRYLPLINGLFTQA
jgi:protoheme IX farnesyltransferase